MDTCVLTPKDMPPTTTPTAFRFLLALFAILTFVWVLSYAYPGHTLRVKVDRDR